MAPRRQSRKKFASASVMTSARIIDALRQQTSPLVDITPISLKSQHNQFEAGYLASFARTMHFMKLQDDKLANVSLLREMAPTVRGYEIMRLDDSAESERHAQELTKFYDNLTCTSALDENERGGYALLFRKLMLAVGYKYSCLEIIWQPTPDFLTAEFRHTPLWFFENTTGRLRFLPTNSALYGEDLEPGAWLVAAGPHLMLPCSIGWLFKRPAMRDWLIYCARHGMPGFLGKSASKPGSDEWKQMEEAVRTLSAEWSGVVAGNDSIDVLQLAAAGQIPHPQLVDRMDRAIASIWRGGDLSTTSAQGPADNPGSSAQADEKEIIDAADCMMISEALNQYVDPFVIQYRLGEGVTPLAYIQVKSRTRKNVAQELSVAQGLHQMGVPLSIKSLRETFNQPEPEDDDDTLMPGAAVPVAPAANARQTALEKANAGLVSDAVAQTLGVRPELIAPFFEKAEAKLADKALSDADLLDALEELALSMPELITQESIAKTAEISAGLLGAAVVNALQVAASGSAVDAANAFNPDQPRDEEGQWTAEGGGAAAQSSAELRRRSDVISKWAHRTETTGAKDIARVARHVRKGASLKDAVAKVNRQKEQEYRRNLGNELYDQMKADGHFKELQP